MPPPLPSRKKDKAKAESVVADGGGGDTPPEVPPKIPPKKNKSKSKKVNEERAPAVLPSPTATPG